MSLFMLLQWFFYPLDFFCIALFPLLFILLPARSLREKAASLLWKFRQPLSVAAGLLLSANFAGLIVYYIVSPAILDHGEVMIIAESWMLQTGHPLFTSLDDAYRYSQIYGPIGNLIYGYFMGLFGPSLFVCKMVAGAAGIACLLAAFLTYRKAFLPWLAWLATALTVLFLLTFKWETFYLKHDPFIILFTTLSLWACVALRSRTASLWALAILTGLLVNLKIHSFFYTLPLFAMLYQQVGLKRMILPGLGSFVVAALPYFSKYISFPNWVAIVRCDPGAQFMAVNILGNLQWFTFFFIPFAALFYFIARRRLPDLFTGLEKEKWFLLTLIFSVGCVCVISAKGGCEPVHLAPFVPIVIYAVFVFAHKLAKIAPAAPAKSAAANKGDQSQAATYSACTDWIAGASLAALVASGLFMAGAEEVSMISALRATNPVSAAVYHDLNEIKKALPGRSISMGYGSTETLLLSQHLLPLLFDNQPFYFNFSAMQGFPNNFLSAKGRAVISDKKVDVWLIPRGDQPFRIRSYYPPNPELFDYNFRNAFEANYERRGQSQFFDVYVAKGRP